MLKRHILFFSLLFLLISTGIVLANAPSSFVLHRFVALSGGTADSANYEVRSVIGQPSVGTIVNAEHKVSSGFFPQEDVHIHRIWLPVVTK